MSVYITEPGWEEVKANARGWPMDQHTETCRGTMLEICLLCYLIALEQTSHPAPAHQILLLVTHGAVIASPHHQHSVCRTVAQTL